MKHFTRSTQKVECCSPGTARLRQLPKSGCVSAAAASRNTPAPDSPSWTGARLHSGAGLHSSTVHAGTLASSSGFVTPERRDVWLQERPPPPEVLQDINGT
ncbi:hypothetical protein DPEC_G00174670 [Dallia pectoralis]|uniref:Uncharacterized protein n=1 Tax=Dallia pectoralis TaxID=75939 RepID=A0ACC2GE70_DALPE|nr:hypothetical protein DPEC_G00174670 [Dallia pectoralis]